MSKINISPEEKIAAAIRNLDVIHRCDKKNIFHSLYRLQRSSKVKNARQVVGNGLDRSSGGCTESWRRNGQDRSLPFYVCIF